MSLAIEVTRLRKSYGNHTVLKGLDFQVKKAKSSPCSAQTAQERPRPLSA